MAKRKAVRDASAGASRKRARAAAATISKNDHDDHDDDNDTTTTTPRDDTVAATRTTKATTVHSNNNDDNNGERDAPRDDTATAVAAAESMVADIHARRATTDKRMTNRQKCLVLGGRSMNSKDRHLLVDLRGLMPHAREHAKLGRTTHLGDDLAELCTLHQCNTLLYVDPHRSDVTYVWLAQAPRGPSVKLQLANVHTADEVRMAGNCLKYSRPLLHFDRDFEAQPHLRVVRALLHTVFNTPRYHPKSKPFVDHMLAFFYLDGHVWVRNYQIVPTTPPSLLEIGPRFTLEPVAIFDCCCRGRVLWRSAVAKPPTEQRRARKLRRVEKMRSNEAVRAMAETHRALHPAPPVDPLDLVFKS